MMTYQDSPSVLIDGLLDLKWVKPVRNSGKTTKLVKMISNTKLGEWVDGVKGFKQSDDQQLETPRAQNRVWATEQGEQDKDQGEEISQRHSSVNQFQRTLPYCPTRLFELDKVKPIHNQWNCALSHEATVHMTDSQRIGYHYLPNWKDRGDSETDEGITDQVYEKTEQLKLGLSQARQQSPPLMMRDKMNELNGQIESLRISSKRSTLQQEDSKTQWTKGNHNTENKGMKRKMDSSAKFEALMGEFRRGMEYRQKLILEVYEGLGSVRAPNLEDGGDGQVKTS
ncbi:hypothetical protein PPACK8108_LOCUS5851 [Phakopsora pachyrhizi]|uniref:Uncharacterized protein n=1 Tax=Phakopsora pachyrhizi TaxID=170000 RepID=A0AAV0APN7_PHAPC|nr:hypothetical protein PPACK8108_LOCUS5851 [Phakopsora pachyrhizi]